MAPRLALIVLTLASAGCDRASEPPAPASESIAASAAPLPGAPSSRGAQPIPLDSGDACGAGKLAGYVGALPSDDLLAKIRAQVGERTIRVIHPGDVVTMDFSPVRLNAETGADGRIKSFRCG